mmetsp:Transcript_11471/g.42814  ORF Transcript_11471/g.42814 Transcript_11471/m.42814 type:complete len:359 (-) Transcript_11471:630-1706(-)
MSAMSRIRWMLTRAMRDPLRGGGACGDARRSGSSFSAAFSACPALVSIASFSSAPFSRPSLLPPAPATTTFGCTSHSLGWSGFRSIRSRPALPMRARKRHFRGICPSGSVARNSGDGSITGGAKFSCVPADRRTTRKAGSDARERLSRDDTSSYTCGESAPHGSSSIGPPRRRTWKRCRWGLTSMNDGCVSVPIKPLSLPFGTTIDWLSLSSPTSSASRPRFLVLFRAFLFLFLCFDTLISSSESWPSTDRADSADMPAIDESSRKNDDGGLASITGILSSSRSCWTSSELTRFGPLGSVMCWISWRKLSRLASSRASLTFSLCFTSSRMPRSFSKSLRSCCMRRKESRSFRRFLRSL